MDILFIYLACAVLGRVWPAAAGRQFPTAKPCRREILVLKLASQVQQETWVKRVVGGKQSATIKGASVYLLSKSTSKAGGVRLLNRRVWLVIVLWLGMRLISPHDKACLSLTLSQILLLLLAPFLLLSSFSGVGRILSSLLEHAGSLLASWNFETRSFPSST